MQHVKVAPVAAAAQDEPGRFARHTPADTIEGAPQNAEKMALDMLLRCY